MTHATNKDAGGTDPILAIAAMEERLKAVEEYLGIVIGSSNLTLPKASPEIAIAIQEIQKAHAGQTESPLKQSDLPSRSSATIPAPFQAEEFGISRDIPICPDPTGEGSAWQGEIVKRSPAGWIFGGSAKTHPNGAPCPGYESFWIIPDPSIPWGEEYEAILPEEAKKGDEYWASNKWRKSVSGQYTNGFPWRRRKSPAPAEPAPGSDAEHPPIGYKLATVGDVYEKGYLIYFIGVWTSGGEQNTGLYILPHGIPIANPIQPAEIDRDTRDTEIAELRATVERLTAENAALDAQRNDAIKSRNQYRKELEELEEKMDAIKELAG